MYTPQMNNNPSVVTTAKSTYNGASTRKKSANR